MSNTLIVNTENTRVFIGHNRFSTADYTNSGGSPVTLAKGTLLGRITATGKVVPHSKSATDGSEVPLGILADDYAVAASGTVKVTYCDTGEVDEGLIILAGADTLDTVITDVGIIRDVIQRNTLIKLIKVTELTRYDNQ